MPKFATYVPLDEKNLAQVVENAEPTVKIIERTHKSLDCPKCQTPAPRRCFNTRKIHDYGDESCQKPMQIHLRQSKHSCPKCRKFFGPQTSDIAPPRAAYTHRVIRHAIRLVAEDNLPYRSASWNLWRDHAVFVPFATIQNWVEAAGKKNRDTRPPARLPR